MKTFYKLTFKSASAFLSVMLALVVNSPAQTPQYYNSNTGTSLNSFPFNMSTGKAVNTLFRAGEFNQPAPIPYGQQITKVYFRTGSAGTRTFTDLHILMRQDTITTLTSGSFNAGPYDTVYHHTNVSTSSTSGGWMAITLDHPYPYNPAKSLILFVGQCGYSGSGASVFNSTFTGVRRVWSVGGCPFTPYPSGDSYVVNFGVDVVPIPPPPTPPYYNTISGTGSNTFPFGQTGGQRVHWLIRKGTLITPVPAPPGIINAIYFRMASTAIVTFTNLTVKLGQASITTLPTAWYTTGMDTVYFRSSVTITSQTNGWMVFTLDEPFSFDTSKALIIDIQQCQASNSGMYVRQSLGTPATRCYGTAGTGCPINYAGQDGQIINFGINLINLVSVPRTGTTIPASYGLGQNYPNPFNPVTTISYSIPKAGNVRISVFDVLGREVAVLVNESKIRGSYNIDFNASELSSGVYFYKLTAGDFTDTKKMVIIK